VEVRHAGAPRETNFFMRVNSGFGADESFEKGDNGVLMFWQGFWREDFLKNQT